MACSRLLSGLYRVSSGDQRTRRVKEQTGDQMRGTSNYVSLNFIFFHGPTRKLRLFSCIIPVTSGQVEVVRASHLLLKWAYRTAVKMRGWQQNSGFSDKRLFSSLVVTRTQSQQQWLPDFVSSCWAECAGQICKLYKCRRESKINQRSSHGCVGHMDQWIQMVCTVEILVPPADWSCGKSLNQYFPV